MNELALHPARACDLRVKMVTAQQGQTETPNAQGNSRMTWSTLN